MRKKIKVAQIVAHFMSRNISIKSRAMIFQMKFPFKPLSTKPAKPAKGSLKAASHAGNDEIRSLRKIIAKLDEDRWQR